MGKTRSKPLSARHGRGDGMGAAWYVWIGLYWSQRTVGFAQRKPLPRSNTNSTVRNYTSVWKEVERCSEFSCFAHLIGLDVYLHNLYLQSQIHHQRQNAQSSFVGCLLMLPVSKAMQHGVRGKLKNDGLGKKIRRAGGSLNEVPFRNLPERSQ